MIEIFSNLPQKLLLIGALSSFLFFFYHSAVYYYTLIRNYFIRKKLKGTTVLITNGTDAIGKELARVFLESKINVVITGEEENKISEAVEYLNKYKKSDLISIKTLKVNFNQKINKEEIIQNLRALEIENHSLSCFFNTQEMVNEKSEFFHKTENTQKLIENNLTNVLEFSHLILNNFLKVRGKNSSYMIFLGNITGDFPSPLSSIFSASKAFISHFCQTLSYELNSQNVHVEIINPMIVSTDDTMTTNILTPSSFEYAQTIFHTFGVRNKNGAYFIHVIISSFLNFMPNFIKSSLIMAIRLIGLQIAKGGE